MTTKPFPTIAGDAPMSLRQLLDVQDVVGEAALRAAMTSGELPTRNVGGSVGRITTWSAFLRWCEGRDARAAGATSTTEEGTEP